MGDENISSRVRRSGQCLYINIKIVRGRNISDNHNELQEVCADDSVRRNTLSGWASSFHASRVNIAVLPRSRKLSTASNATLMFINSL
jgi:hypothetical protein